jgi:hypothetical protein
MKIASRWRSSCTLLGLALASLGGPVSEIQAEDKIQILPVAESDFYLPGETLQWDATVQSLTEQASQRLVLSAFLYRASDGEMVAKHRSITPLDPSGNSLPVAIEFPAPEQPGVYELRCELASDDDNLWARFRKQKPPLARVGRALFVGSETLRTDEPLRSSEVSSKASGVGDKAVSRSAWLLLSNADWVRNMIDSQPGELSSDQDFLDASDPRTLSALRLWTAAERLREFIRANGLSGAMLAGDLDAEVYQVAGENNPARVLLLEKIFRSHEIETIFDTTRIAEPIATVDLDQQRIPQHPAGLERLPQQTELTIAAVLNAKNPFTLLVRMPIGERPLGDQAQTLLQSYCAIPCRSLMPVATSDATNATVQICRGTFQEQQYISLLSVAPWANEVVLEFEQPAELEVVAPALEQLETWHPDPAQPTRYRIGLRPGQLVLLRTREPAPELAIRSWVAGIRGGTAEIENIKSEVAAIVQRLGLLSDLEPSNSLTNGSFEQSGGIGLVGWMHAQHPPGCVQIDDQESIAGEHSVLLTTDLSVSPRTWIVSQAIEPPDSGRLAISLAARAERVEGGQPHSMRVSIEATRGGKPIRYSADFEVPRNGQWGSQQIVLETDGVGKQSVDSLRLTIDSLSGGRVWLDDVRVHHWFPTAKEREELQSLAFLAVQGLQTGNFTPSSRLLQNHWARYLLTVTSPDPAKPMAETKPEEKPTGVAERIRDWLPRPIRF